MDWPVFLLHVVRCEQVRYTGQFVQQVVLKSEHRSRPHDSGLGENRSGKFLATSLMSPSATIPCSVLDLRGPTLVRKNSEGELGSAL